MLIIRLTRVGKKNNPSFRVVLTERQNPVKGKFIEILGYYNAQAKTRDFKKERILYWISKGAQCSVTVHNLLVNDKIIKGPKQKAWHAKKPVHPPVGPPAGEAGKAGSPAEPDNVAGKEAAVLSPEAPVEGKEKKSIGKPVEEKIKESGTPSLLGEKPQQAGDSKPETSMEHSMESKTKIPKEQPEKLKTEIPGETLKEGPASEEKQDQANESEK